MTGAEAEALIKSITYKPGYRLRVCCNKANRTCEIRLKAHRECSRTGKMVVFSSAKTLDLGRYCDRLCYVASAEEDLMHDVRMWLRELELHEVDEWLKVDGKMVFDPHPVAYKPGRSYVESTPAGHKLK
jgi:hypothetical protein